MRYFLLSLTLFLSLSLLLLTGCAEETDHSTDQHAQDERYGQDLDIGDFKMLDEQPKPLNMKAVTSALKYPDDAKKAGVHGRVVMRVLVGKEGEYVRHKVMKTPDRKSVV